MSMANTMVATFLVFCCVAQLSLVSAKRPAKVVKVIYMDADESGLTLDPNGHRMVETFSVESPDSKLDSNTEFPSDLLECRMYGDRFVINKLLEDEPSETRIQPLVRNSMNLLIDSCSELMYNKMMTGNRATGGGILDGRAIFPKTLWCGAGQLATEWNQLGEEWETDLCCRDHDNCPDSMFQQTSKYNITNWALWTRSHCDCDKQFQDCLKVSKTEIANRMGQMYFNYLGVKCFRKDYPIKECKRYFGFIPLLRTCQEYTLDTQQERIWQLFDPPMFTM